MLLQQNLRSALHRVHLKSAMLQLTRLLSCARAGLMTVMSGDVTAAEALGAPSAMHQPHLRDGSAGMGAQTGVRLGRQVMHSSMRAWYVRMCIAQNAEELECAAQMSSCSVLTRATEL